MRVSRLCCLALRTTSLSIILGKKAYSVTKPYYCFVLFEGLATLQWATSEAAVYETVLLEGVMMPCTVTRSTMGRIMAPSWDKIMGCKGQGGVGWGVADMVKATHSARESASSQGNHQALL